MSHTVLKADVFNLPLPDASVDTIITDPPWHFQQRVSAGSKAVKASDYELIDDGRMGEAFWQMERVLKPGGHLYVFCPERKLNMVVAMLNLDPDCDTIQWFNTIIWAKVRKDGTDLRIGLGHTYRQSWEAILCLSRGHRHALTARNVPNVLFHEPLGGSRKPPEIYRRLAVASTEPGGTILDPFCGSDPLGAANLEGYTTISSDIADWKGK